MKNHLVQKCLLCLIILVAFSACNQGKNGNQSISTHPTSSIDTSKLKGVWWSVDKDLSHAAFEIGDSTFYYPDREGQSEFHYQVRLDTLIIYFRGFNDNSIVKKLTNDTLILLSTGDTSVFVRSKG